MTLLERLLRALAKEPELEMALALKLRAIKLYGPWVSDGRGNFVITDPAGEHVAAVLGNGDYDGDDETFSWASQGDCGVAASFAWACTHAEAALEAAGWRKVPTHLWVNVPPPVGTPSVMPWVHTKDRGWVRRSWAGNVLASVEAACWPGENVQWYWSLWPEGTMEVFPAEVRPRLSRGVADLEHAKFEADRVLVEEGLLPPALAETDPDIHF